MRGAAQKSLYRVISTADDVRRFPGLKSIRGRRLWWPWVTVSSILFNCNLSFSSCSFHRQRGWRKTEPEGPSAQQPVDALCTERAHTHTHTLASDQYQALWEEHKFCAVMATPSDRWDATDITSSVDWLPALSALSTRLDRSFYFALFWRDEIKREVITDWRALQRHFAFN